MCISSGQLFHSFALLWHCYVDETVCPELWHHAWILCWSLILSGFLNVSIIHISFWTRPPFPERALHYHYQLFCLTLGNFQTYISFGKLVKYNTLVQFIFTKKETQMNRSVLLSYSLSSLLRCVRGRSENGSTGRRCFELGYCIPLWESISLLWVPEDRDLHQPFWTFQNLYVLVSFVEVGRCSPTYSGAIPGWTLIHLSTSGS